MLISDFPRYKTTIFQWKLWTDERNEMKNLNLRSSKESENEKVKRISKTSIWIVQSRLNFLHSRWSEIKEFCGASICSHPQQQQYSFISSMQHTNIWEMLWWHSWADSLIVWPVWIHFFIPMSDRSAVLNLFFIKLNWYHFVNIYLLQCSSE